MGLEEFGLLLLIIVLVVAIIEFLLLCLCWSFIIPKNT